MDIKHLDNCGHMIHDNYHQQEQCHIHMNDIYISDAQVK
jgi:hypothetical protein